MENYSRLERRLRIYVFNLLSYTTNDKMKPIKISTLFVITLSLLLHISCDCMQRLQGYVIDAETGEPLSGVLYSNAPTLTAREKLDPSMDTLYQNRTDSTGWFMDWRLVSGSNCKPYLVLWLEKEGYRSVKLDWKRNQSSLDTLVVELHRDSRLLKPLF